MKQNEEEDNVGKRRVMAGTKAGRSADDGVQTFEQKSSTSRASYMSYMGCSTTATTVLYMMDQVVAQYFLSAGMGRRHS